ncbi:hypothetical protein HELRODRAFT_162820 [Helobdella robusta]|uniref:Uncharacterized protein n=1 Tax=Helobdella robusta TaxID=6412 RepID=T1ET78_HELRO|nr:hypothetical protein HELRODRAFT_162820 [Helobdella robusta]ESN99301.1 hypothetical protein HELRODRAFT_162820 [Helobdella robusta]
MTSLAQYINAAKELGLTGEEASKFIDKHEERERQREERERESQEREKQRMHDIEMARIQQQKNDNGNCFDKFHQLRKMLPFNEDTESIDLYLARLRIWLVLLNYQNRNQYSAVKDALLRQFGATEDEYKKKFLHSVPDHKDDPRLFITNMTMYFDRWLAMANVNKTYEAIRNLIILDTVINAYNEQVQVFVKERCPRTVDAWTTLIQNENQGRTWKSRWDSTQQNSNKSSYCKICKKNNHRTDNCYFRDSKKASTQYKPTNKVFFAKIQQGDGKLTLISAFVDQQKCIALRDTGTITLLIHQNCVRPQSYTGEYEKVKNLKDEISTHPIAIIYVDSPYLTGWHKALVLEQPLDGIDLIIGNVADVKECTEADITHWQNHHDINKSMAITRSQNRKEKALEKLDQNYTQPQPIAEQTMLAVHDEVKMNNNNNETENSGEKNVDHVHDEVEMNDSNDNETENNVEENYNVPPIIVIQRFVVKTRHQTRCSDILQIGCQNA